MKNKFFVLLTVFSLIFSNLQPAKAQDQTDYPVYEVQSGDTLTGIAEKFDVNLNDLININGISDSNSVTIGMQLLIPGVQGLHGVITTTPVQLGENLKALTLRYKIDQSLLMKLNHITSPGEIYVGSNLILPQDNPDTAPAPIAKFSSSTTLLETAARNQTTTWNLLDQNEYANQFQILPGDMIYAKSSENSTTISAVDPQLNDVSISPLPLVQGQTFEITVDSPQPVTLSGSLNGSPLHFFSTSDNKQVALQGIYAMAEPGLAPFSLSGKYSDGTEFSFSQSVLLLSGDYPDDEPLTVDPATIDPAVTQPEMDFVTNLTAPANADKLWNGMWQSPGYYQEYNSLFGERRNYNDGALLSFHAGLDFAGGMGLPIVAPADGVVVFAGPLTIRGNATFIDHGWGVYSAYFHQSEIEVKTGDKVTAGQEIGKVGNTGRVNEADAYEGAGAHLHWEIWVNGIQVDPLQWLNNQYP